VRHRELRGESILGGDCGAGTRVPGTCGRINQVCFVGGSDTLCSVSADGRASLWSVSGGFRLVNLGQMFEGI